jgi:hypothetical protein
LRKSVSRGIIDLIPSRDKAFWPSRVLRINVIAFPVVLHVRCVVTGERSWRWFVYLSFSPTGKIAGCNCGKASVSPCAFTSGGNRRFPQVAKKMYRTGRRKIVFERKKITFRQVTKVKGINFAVRLPIAEKEEEREEKEKKIGDRKKDGSQLDNSEA